MSFLTRLWHWWFPMEGLGRVQWPTRSPLHPTPYAGRGKSIREMMRGIR